MKLLESLQERISESEELRRVEVLGSNSRASGTTVVLARVPPRYEFPLHIHPQSEDCFFVLSGAGEVFGARERFAISEVAGVWIPPGVPHGLAAGARGVLEIGFQSPPGPTVEIDSPSLDNSPFGIVAASIPPMPTPNAQTPEWNPVFAERPGWRHLNPQFCLLESSEQLHAVANGHELFVVVARGAVELCRNATRVRPLTVVQLNPGESQLLNAVEDDTLLINIQAPPA